VFFCVLSDAARTRGWKVILSFTYQDPKSLVLIASRGGTDVTDDAVLVWGKALSGVLILER